jgi:hypothetical protein
MCSVKRRAAAFEVKELAVFDYLVCRFPKGMQLRQLRDVDRDPPRFIAVSLFDGFSVCAIATTATLLGRYR